MAFKRFSFNEHAFLANYALLSSRTAGECGAVVKGNAYGTGAKRAVTLLDQAGCQHFFVATPEEGAEICELTTKSIYVLSGPIHQSSVQLLKRHNLIPVLNTPNQLLQWRPNRELPCALHVDTGMNRLGFDVDTLQSQDLASFNTSLVMTHLACADDPDHPQNEQQLKKFNMVTTHFPDTPTSIGNSAGIFMGELFQGDITRPGIGMYGGNPFLNLESPVSSVCTFEGQVLQLRDVPRGTPIGYGASFIAPTQMRVGVIGVGYADGMSRALSNNGWVAFRGQRMPIIGKITMDATHVDCTQVPELQENDYVELFGPTISVDEVALWTDTIAYEILTHIGNASTRG